MESRKLIERVDGGEEGTELVQLAPGRDDWRVKAVVPDGREHGLAPQDVVSDRAHELRDVTQLPAHLIGDGGHKRAAGHGRDLRHRSYP